MRAADFLVVAVTLCMAAACNTTPPKPSESEYFVSAGGGFNFDRDAKTASYGITLESKGNVRAGNAIEARFENPAGGDDLVQTIVAQEGQTRFVFTSPPVQGLRAYTNYSIEFILYESSSKEIVLGTHKQQLQSLVNQADLGW